MTQDVTSARNTSNRIAGAMQEVVVGIVDMPSAAAVLDMSERHFNKKLEIFHGQTMPFINQLAKDLDDRNACIAEYDLQLNAPMMIQPNEAEIYQAAAQDHENFSRYAAQLGITVDVLVARLDCYYKDLATVSYRNKLKFDQLYQAVTDVLSEVSRSRESVCDSLDSLGQVLAQLAIEQPTEGGGDEPVTEQ